jgi:hypothetical protein
MSLAVPMPDNLAEQRPELRWVSAAGERGFEFERGMHRLLASRARAPHARGSGSTNSELAPGPGSAGTPDIESQSGSGIRARHESQTLDESEIQSTDAGVFEVTNQRVPQMLRSYAARVRSS